MYFLKEAVWQCTWCLRAKPQAVWSRVPCAAAGAPTECIPCARSSGREGDADELITPPPASPILSCKVLHSHFKCFRVFLGLFKGWAVCTSVAAQLFIDIVSVMKEMTYRKWKIKIRYLRYYKRSLFAVLHELQASRNGIEGVCKYLCFV